MKPPPVKMEGTVAVELAIKLSTWTKVFRYFALLEVGLQPTG